MDWSKLSRWSPHSRAETQPSRRRLKALATGLAFGVLEPISFLVALSSGAATAALVWARNAIACQWVALSYRFTPLAAVLAALLGLALGIAGEPVGWLVLAGSIVAVPTSMIGLAIITRAEEYDVIRHPWAP